MKISEKVEVVKATAESNDTLYWTIEGVFFRTVL